MSEEMTQYFLSNFFDGLYHFIFFSSLVMSHWMSPI